MKDVKKWEDYDILELPDGTKIDMAKLLDEQDRAKAALAHIEPFFGGMIGKIRFVYTFHVDTQATDGYNIFVNPLFTSKLDLEQKVFVLAHEIMHCVLNHMRRSKIAGHDHHKSNIAGDYEINTYLEQMGIVSLDTIKRTEALYDKKYNDWGYEKIYDSNPSGPSQNQQDPQQQKNQNSKDSGQGSGGSSNQNQGPKSKDWIDGWNKAMEDYKNGKIKL